MIPNMRDLMTLAESAWFRPPLVEAAHDFDPALGRTLFDLDRKANMNKLTGADKREFAQFLKDHRADHVVMYHGTSIRHDVQLKGLLPTSAKRRLSLQSGSGYVYLTYDPHRAATFASFGYPGRAPYVVYAVKVGIWELLPDPDQLRNKRMWGDNPDIGTKLVDSMIYGGGARVKGMIPSTQISVYGYFDSSGRQVDKPDKHEWTGTIEPRRER